MIIYFLCSYDNNMCFGKQMIYVFSRVKYVILKSLNMHLSKNKI